MLPLCYPLMPRKPSKPKKASLPKRDLLSLPEIAKFKGVTRQAVFLMVKRNKIAHQKIGNVILIKRSDLHLLGI